MQFERVLDPTMAGGEDADRTKATVTDIITRDMFLAYYNDTYSDAEVQDHATRLRDINTLDDWKGMPELVKKMKDETKLKAFVAAYEIDRPDEGATEALLIADLKKRIKVKDNALVKSARVPENAMKDVIAAMAWDKQFDYNVSAGSIVEAVKSMDKYGDLAMDDKSGVQKGVKDEMDKLVAMIKTNEEGKPPETQSPELMALDLDAELGKLETTEAKLKWLVDLKSKASKAGVNQDTINANAAGLAFSNVMGWWKEQSEAWATAEAESEAKWKLSKESRQQVDEIFEWSLVPPSYLRLGVLEKVEPRAADAPEGLDFRQFNRFIRCRDVEDFTEGATSDTGSSQFQDLCHFVGQENPSNGITREALTEIYDNALEPLDLGRDLKKLKDRKMVVWPPPPQPLEEVLRVEHENSENLRNFTLCLDTKVARDGRTKLFGLPPRTIDALWNSRNRNFENNSKTIVQFRVVIAKIFRVMGLPVMTLHRTERLWSELTVEQRRAGIRLGYTAEVWDQQIDEFGTPAFPKRKGAGDDGPNNVIVEWYNEGPIVPFTAIGKPKNVVNTVVSPFAAALDVVKELLSGDRVKYAFFVKAYKPECYYWELVEYARKFILSGVLIFIQPGSITQVFVGSVISITYAVLIARLMPYADPITNQTKLLAESVLAFIFVCTLCMRHNLAREFFGKPEYTQFMIWVMMLGTILPALLNIFLAISKYVESLGLLQDSLNKGSSSGQEKNTNLTFTQRLKHKGAQLYQFGEQLATAFDDLEETVTGGAEEEDDEEDLESDEAKKKEDEDTQDGDDQDDDEFGIEERTKIPEGAFVMNPVTQRISPKLSTDLDADAKGKLANLGYSDISDWEEERPAMVNGKPIESNFDSLSEQQQKDAKSLGFTPANWKYYMVEKHYSTLVGERTEMMNWLTSSNRMTTTGLAKLWKEAYGEKAWLGRVKLTQDDVFGVITSAWKACERSAIQHALELYQLSYMSTFQAHVEAGIQGSDPMDFDWDELSETQRGAAEELGWEQPRWDMGGVPVTLRDDNNRKLMWKDLDALQRESGKLLGYVEESWDQVDKLAVMDGSAMRITIRSMARESHIGPGSKIKDPHEFMEMTLLKIAYEGRVLHQLGPADTEAHMEKVAGQKELYRDCWIKTKALWQSPQLKQDVDKSKSDGRNRAARVVMPRGAMNGTDWAESLAANTVINAILDRRRDLALLYAEIPGPAAEARSGKMPVTGHADGWVYPILTKFEAEEDGFVDESGSAGELLPCKRLPTSVLERVVVEKKVQGGAPGAKEVVPTEVKHKLKPNAKIMFVPIPNPEGREFKMPDHHLGESVEADVVPAKAGDTDYDKIDCPLSGTYRITTVGGKGDAEPEPEPEPESDGQAAGVVDQGEKVKLKIYTQAEWKGLIRIQNKCQWLRLHGMNAFRVRRTGQNTKTWSTERLDELMIELRTKTLNELITMAEQIQVPQHTLNAFAHHVKGARLSMPTPKGLASAGMGLAKMSAAQAKALGSALDKAVTLEDFDQAANGEVKRQMKENNPRSVFEILRKSQASPAGIMERLLGEFEGGKLRSDDDMNKLKYVHKQSAVVCDV